MPERDFLIFNFLFYFFRNFLAQVENERNSGQFFFFLSFLAFLIPFWLKIIPERGFLIFWIFFGIFLNGSRTNEIRDKIFFLSFSTYLIPFWLKIMPERGFLIFWIFLLFFLEFSCTGWVRTEFGTKIFFTLSWPISSHFG